MNDKSNLTRMQYVNRFKSLKLPVHNNTLDIYHGIYNEMVVVRTLPDLKALFRNIVAFQSEQ